MGEIKTTGVTLYNVTPFPSQSCNASRIPIDMRIQIWTFAVVAWTGLLGFGSGRPIRSDSDTHLSKRYYVSWDNNDSFPASLNCATIKGMFQDDHTQAHQTIKNTDLEIATSNRVECDHRRGTVPNGMCKGHVKDVPMDVVVVFRAIVQVDKSTGENFSQFFFLSAHTSFVSGYLYNLVSREN